MCCNKCYCRSCMKSPYTILCSDIVAIDGCYSDLFWSVNNVAQSMKSHIPFGLLLTSVWTISLWNQLCLQFECSQGGNVHHSIFKQWQKYCHGFIFSAFQNLCIVLRWSHHSIIAESHTGSDKLHVLPQLHCRGQIYRSMAANPTAPPTNSQYPLTSILSSWGFIILSKGTLTDLKGVGTDSVLDSETFI